VHPGTTPCPVHTEPAEAGASNPRTSAPTPSYPSTHSATAARSASTRSASRPAAR